MRTTIRRYWLIVSSIMVLSACTTPAPPDGMTSTDMALVYGHFRTGAEITKVELRKYGEFYLPPFRRPPRVLIFKNGNFLAENIKPGKYYISTVYTKFKYYSIVKDSRTAYQDIITVKPGSINYAGSYQIFDMPDDERLKQKFSVTKVRKPSEHSILKHLYEITAGTQWQQRIDQRIKQLRVN